MTGYPFTSELSFDEHGMPMYDRAVDSRFLRAMHARYFSDGVFYKPVTALQVGAADGMIVQISPGACHIQGAMGIEENICTKELASGNVLPRIDTVVVRLDLSRAVRNIVLDVVTGTPAENPVAPNLTRDDTVWELGLANVYVTAGATIVAQSDITDTRMDSARCGLVAVPVGTPDFTAYFVQLQAIMEEHHIAASEQIAQLRRVIREVEMGTAAMLTAVYDPGHRGEDIFAITDALADGVQIFEALFPADGWTPEAAEGAGDGTEDDGGPAVWTQTAACPGLLAAYDLEAPQVPVVGVRETDAALKEGLDALCEAGNSGETLD
ncbi:MAG: hypothetical protein NC311_09030, partial [Muribaculaceae bacterium]|nr:hypothetical protein [Muribaculaceae bacterium]